MRNDQDVRGFVLLIDAYRGSTSLAAAALAVLSDPNREFVSSDVVKLEVLPKATYNSRGGEVAFYQTYFAAVTHWVPVTPQLAGRALATANTFGLGAIDALHVTAAEEVGAEFVTSERLTSPLFRLVPTLRVVSIRPSP